MIHFPFGGLGLLGAARGGRLTLLWGGMLAWQAATRKRYLRTPKNPNWVTQAPVYIKDTLPKFNMEPENDGFQKESPFPGADFQVPC